jgi:hypothetical protein
MLFFEILERIINWYGQRSTSRHLKAILQQGTYEKELEEKIDVFKAKVHEIQKEGMLSTAPLIALNVPRNVM